MIFIDDNEPGIPQTEAEILQMLKEKLNSMKFFSSATQFAEIYLLLEELMELRHVSKNQVSIKLKLRR